MISHFDFFLVMLRLLPICDTYLPRYLCTWCHSTQDATWAVFQGTFYLLNHSFEYVKTVSSPGFSQTHNELFHIFASFA
jgi:hypothetical protein